MPFFRLKSPNLEKLKAIGDVEGLMNCLRDKDEHVRTQVLDALIDLVTDAALRQHNLAALSALQSSAKVQAVQRLKEILREISPIVSSWRNTAVAEALIGLGAADAVLEYYDAHVWGDLKDGLFMLDVLGLLTGYTMSKRDPYLLKKLLQSGPFDYLEVLSGRHFCFAHLASEMGKPVHQAADLLSEIGSEEDLLSVEQQARSHSVREWVWSTLGKVGTAKSLPTLIKAVQTGGQPGEWAFANLIPRLSIDDLNRLAQHSQSSIKNPALLEICKRSDPSTFEVILSAASSETDWLSVAAIEALGRMRRTDAVARLSTLLQSLSVPVWRAAAAALGTIGDKNGLSSLLALSPEKLVDDVVLKAITEGNVTPMLLEIMKLRLNQFSSEELLKLVLALRKHAAASDLTELQDTLALPYVETLRDPKWAQRKAAITALGQIGGNVAMQALNARKKSEKDYELSQKIKEALIEAQR